jgi:hypothetical protein
MAAFFFTIALVVFTWVDSALFFSSMCSLKPVRSTGAFGVVAVEGVLAGAVVWLSSGMAVLKENKTIDGKRRRIKHLRKGRIGR